MSKCWCTSRSSSERNVQRAPVAIFSLYTSCRLLGMMVTSSVNATEHHSWKRRSIAMVHPLARAVLAAAEMQNEGVVALQLREPVHVAVLVGQHEVGDRRPRLEVLAHVRVLLARSARTHAGDAEPHPVDARLGGEVERAAVRVAPGQVVRVLGQLDQCELL